MASRKFTLRIQESFSGVEGSFVDVFSDRSSCGVDFVFGKPYLVDALKDGRGNITVNLCSLTRPAARAPEEIAIQRRVAARQSLLGILGQLVELRPKRRLLDPEVLQPRPDVSVESSAGPRPVERSLIETADSRSGICPVVCIASVST